MAETNITPYITVAPPDTPAQRLEKLYKVEEDLAKERKREQAAKAKKAAKPRTRK